MAACGQKGNGHLLPGGPPGGGASDAGSGDGGGVGGVGGSDGGATCMPCSPPPPACVSAQVLRTFASSGCDSHGQCSFASQDQFCPTKTTCIAGACATAPSCTTSPQDVRVVPGDYSGGDPNVSINDEELPALLWTGTTFVLTHYDHRQASTYPFDTFDGGYLTTVGSDGALGAEHQLQARQAVSGMAWNGSDIAALWYDPTHRFTPNPDVGPDANTTPIQLVHLSVAGTALAPSQTVFTKAGDVEYGGTLIWNGSDGYGAAWYDGYWYYSGIANQQPQLIDEGMVAALKADGTPRSMPVTLAVDDASVPPLAWNGSGYATVTSRADDQTPSNSFLGTAIFDGSGKYASFVLDANKPRLPYYTQIAWNGSGYGRIWDDEGTLYFTTLDTGGKVAGKQTQLDDSVASPANLNLLWTGESYYALWNHNVGSQQANEKVAMAHLSAQGDLLSAPSIVSTRDYVYLNRITAVWNGAGILAAWSESSEWDKQQTTYVPHVYYRLICP